MWTADDRCSVPAPGDLAVRGAAQAAADRVLTLLGVPVAMEVDLVEGPVRDTLGALLKYQDDVLKVGGSELYKTLQKARGVS